ncbi:S9 family peptidase [Luteococcus peritonei]|uniref:S9 family peptidase n=1 Tax=Luteococcus peritonei TaxID=88874 RepID=A0ABW4RRK4_9ACTN
MPMPDPALAPVAPTFPITRSFHGDEVIDDYEWLRDKQDPRVISHLEAENAWTERCTEHLAGLRQEIFDDISVRTQQTDLSVPARATHETAEGRRAWWYYTRTVEGSDYPIHCRVADTTGERPDLSSAVAGEQVLLDGNREAEGHDFFQLGAFSVSPDGRLLAWSVDHAGDERYDLYLRDLATGTDTGPLLQGIAAGIAWAGNDFLFYSRVDEAWRPFQVWRHELGGTGEDALVLQEDDERFWLGVEESRDRSHLVFTAGTKLTSEWWLLPTADPTGVPRSVAGRTEGLDYSVELAGDQLLVLHNRDCIDFSLASAPLDATSPEQWTTVVEGQQGTRLEGVEAYQGHAVLSGRREGLSAVALLHRQGEGWGQPQWVAFDEPVHDVWPASEADWDSPSVRLHYTSLVTPASILECRLADGSTSWLKRTPVLDHPVHGPYEPTDYVQERIWAPAADGTLVPISLVHHKDVVPDGSAPCLLYGYGSYEVSIPPFFSVARLSLLQRGIVFAIAHIRGGGEMGRAWYDQGKELTKKNTFTDFVDCARHLVELGWTSPDRLAARGRSAGGLLMGAVTNLAPELFRAVNAGVPFVDALTTILNPDLPLTAVEWEEWGNPITDAEVYAYMKSYTPYENISGGRYPAILATTSLNDTRVFFTEPAKWVAKLRQSVEPSAERPILLKTEMVAGHGGVSGRYGSWREEAFELAWIIEQIDPTLQAGREQIDPTLPAGRG